MSAKGQRIGYVRVSSYDQNPERQLEHLHADRVFTDKASGKDTERPELQSLLQYAREGDTIVVHSMDRLARNVDDLCRIVLARPGAASHGIHQGEPDVHGRRLPNVVNSAPPLPVIIPISLNVEITNPLYH